MNTTETTKGSKTMAAISPYQEQRIRRLAFRLSEYNPSDDDAFYDAAVVHITEFAIELNDIWDVHAKTSRDYDHASQACQPPTCKHCGSRDMSVSRDEPIKCGKCGTVRDNV